MVQSSSFWDNNGVGDAQTYSFDDWTDLWSLLFTTDRTTMGVISDHLNQLEVTANGAQTVQIDTGGALVDGKLYLNPVAFDISALGLTATGQIIARKTTASGTVRVVNKAIGALTQTTAVWEIQLATWSTDGAGVVTVVDTRVFGISPLADDFAVGSANMQLIETVDGDGSSGLVDFTAIPATFDHLFFQGIARTDRAVLTDTLGLRFNGDAGANYNDNNLKGNHNVYGADENQTQNEFQIGLTSGANATANRFSAFKGWIPYYKETGFDKGVIFESALIPDDAVSVAWEERSGGGGWLSAVAINRIAFVPVSGIGNFIAGTTVSLYGIKS